MKQLVEFTLEDNSTILVEVEEPESSGIRPVSRGKIKVLEAQKTFEEAWDNLKPTIAAIKKKLDSMSEPADEVEVKFGVKLSGQAGAILTVGAEATYEVTLKWSKQQ